MNKEFRCPHLEPMGRCSAVRRSQAVEKLGLAVAAEQARLPLGVEVDKEKRPWQVVCGLRGNGMAQEACYRSLGGGGETDWKKVAEALRK